MGDMQGRRNVLVLLAAALWLAACSTPIEQAWVAVHGPVAEELSLEIGESAWQLTPADGDGVAAVNSNAPVTVRLIRVSDCHVYAEFEAEPGSRHVIRIDARDPTSATVEEVDAMAMGPGLGERADGPTNCG